jgi:hypothetical protein
MQTHWPARPYWPELPADWLALLSNKTWTAAGPRVGRSRRARSVSPLALRGAEADTLACPASLAGAPPDWLALMSRARQPQGPRVGSGRRARAASLLALRGADADTLACPASLAGAWQDCCRAPGGEEPQGPHHFRHTGLDDTLAD